jgi:hypothetical protein
MSALRLDNSNDIVVNSIKLPLNGELINVVDYLSHGVMFDDLALKADKTTVYHIPQIDNKLTLKANQTTTYTKTESDAALTLKANQATTYTMAQIDSSLALKANQTTTYTMAQIDSSLALKAKQNKELINMSGDMIHNSVEDQIIDGLNF